MENTESETHTYPNTESQTYTQTLNDNETETIEDNPEQQGSKSNNQVNIVSKQIDLSKMPLEDQQKLIKFLESNNLQLSQQFSSDDKQGKNGEGILMGVSKLTNQDYVLKKIDNLSEYQSEKETYIKFLLDEDIDFILKEAAYLEQQQKPTKPEDIPKEIFNFNDDLMLLVIPRAEIDLLNFMKIVNQIFEDKKKDGKIDQNRQLCLDTPQLLQLLKFQVRSMRILEQKGIYMQDNKPANIVVQKQYNKEELKNDFKLKFIDFGYVYDIQKQQNSISKYPTARTKFYYDRQIVFQRNDDKITNEQQQQNIYKNEYHTILITILVCLFPKYQAYQLENEQEKFLDIIYQEYGTDVQQLLQNLITCQNNFVEFEEQIQFLLEKYHEQGSFVNDYTVHEEVKSWKIKLMENFVEQRFNNLKVEQSIDEQIYLLEEQYEEADKNNQLQQQLNYLIKLKQLYQQKHGKKSKEYCVTLQNLAMTYYKLSDYKKSKEAYEICIESQEDFYGKDNHETANAIQGLGAVYYCLRNLEKTKELNEKSLVIKEKHYGKGTFETAEELTNLALAYQGFGDLEKSKELNEQGLEIKEKHYGKGHYQLASTISNLGQIYYQLGNLEKAQELFEQCIEIEEKHFGKGHYDTASTIQDLATVLQNLGQLEKALGFYQQSLEIQENHFGKGDVESAITLSNLGDVYYGLRNLQKAQELYVQSLKIKESYYGKGHIQTANVIEYLGHVHRESGYLEIARDYYKICLQIKQNYHGKNHQALYDTIVFLGFIEKNLGNFEKAKEFLEYGLEIFVKQYGKGYFKTDFALQNLGEIYKALGNCKKAKDCFEQSLKLREKQYGKGHYEMIATLENLSFISEQLGDLQEVESKLKYAFQICKQSLGLEHKKTLEVQRYLQEIQLMIQEQEGKKQQDNI